MQGINKGEGLCMCLFYVRDRLGHKWGAFCGLGKENFDAAWCSVTYEIHADSVEGFRGGHGSPPPALGAPIFSFSEIGKMSGFPPNTCMR